MKMSASKETLIKVILFTGDPLDFLVWDVKFKAKCTTKKQLGYLTGEVAIPKKTEYAAAVAKSTPSDDEKRRPSRSMRMG